MIEIIIMFLIILIIGGLATVIKILSALRYQNEIIIQILNQSSVSLKDKEE